MQVPFRSKSDSGAVNAFVRQTTEELERIFAIYRQLNAGLVELEEAFYLQGLAISQRVAEMEASLVLPLRQGDWWIQRLPATVFTADANGEISKIYRQASLLTGRLSSCLTVQTADGQEIIPAAVGISVTPDLPPGGLETNPLNAVTGFLPWRRRFATAFEASAAYEVTIPVDVLENPVFNRIEVIPYPLYGVDIEQVEINDRGDQTAVLDTPASGPLCLHIVPSTADSVRITLRQAQPFLLNQEHFYCFGLSRVAVGEAVPAAAEALFTARVQLAGYAPWRLIGCSISPSLTGQQVSIEINGEAIPAAALPVSTEAREIVVRVQLTAVRGCRYPYFEQVELMYQSS